MKNLTLILFLVSTLMCFSQERKKETVYILFDNQSNEKCIVEDGSGNSLNVNKFRKEYEDYGNIINFKICNETFGFNKTKSFKDTCSIKALENIKLVDFEYLIKKYNSLNEFKHHVFDKIYFVEKISKNKIIKYEVGWVDEIFMIED
ncbi:hypothetical protein [Tenacibaculum geojense]|uniref:Lipoprotein n=1 Tax=Tenacibaculum geojense TaxID=915352 RepID=A0ABW3JQR0_9FLAO